MRSVGYVNVNVLVVLFVQFYKMLPAEKTGNSIQVVYPYYFLELHVTLHDIFN